MITWVDELIDWSDAEVRRVIEPGPPAGPIIPTTRDWIEHELGGPEPLTGDLHTDLRSLGRSHLDRALEGAGVLATRRTV